MLFIFYKLLLSCFVNYRILVKITWAIVFYCFDRNIQLIYQVTISSFSNLKSKIYYFQLFFISELEIMQHTVYSRKFKKKCSAVLQETILLYLFIKLNWIFMYIEMIKIIFLIVRIGSST